MYACVLPLSAAGIQQDLMDIQCPEEISDPPPEVATTGATPLPFPPPTGNPVSNEDNSTTSGSNPTTFVYHLQDLFYAVPQYLNVFSEVTVSSTDLSPQQQTTSQTSHTGKTSDINEPSLSDPHTAPTPKKKVSSSTGQRIKRKLKCSHTGAQTKASKKKVLNSIPQHVKEQGHKAEKLVTAAQANGVFNEKVFAAVSSVACQTPLVFEYAPVGESANMAEPPDCLAFIATEMDAPRISGVAAKMNLALGEKFGPFTGRFVKSVHGDFNPSTWEVNDYSCQILANF